MRKLCAKVLASWTLTKRYEMEICGKKKKKKRFKLRDEMVVRCKRMAEYSAVSNISCRANFGPRFLGKTTTSMLGGIRPEIVKNDYTRVIE